MGQHFERGQMLFDLGRYREAIQEYLQELAEPANLLWVLFLHLMVSFAAVVFASAPELFAVITAVAICYPLIVAMGRNRKLLTVFICLPTTVVGSIFVIVALVLIAYEKNLSAYLFVVFYYAVAYYFERLARWASSLRLF